MNKNRTYKGNIILSVILILLFIAVFQLFKVINTDKSTQILTVIQIFLGIIIFVIIINGFKLGKKSRLIINCLFITIVGIGATIASFYTKESSLLLFLVGLIFAGIGIFCLITNIKKFNSGEEVDLNAKARLFIVRQVTRYNQTQFIVYLEMLDQHRKITPFYSYLTNDSTFGVGNPYSINYNLINENVPVTNINNLYSKDISYIPRNEIKPVNKTLANILCGNIDYDIIKNKLKNEFIKGDKNNDM